MCGCFSHTPSWGTWPTTQVCALTGSRTCDPLVHRPALNPPSPSSQGNCTSLFQRHCLSFQVMRADRPPEQDLPNETCIRRSLKTNKKVPTFLSSSKRNRSRTRRKESWVQPLRLRDRWGPRRGEGCPCRKGHSRDTPADVSSTAFRPREGRGSGELASTAGPSRGSHTSPGWAGSWLHVLAPPSRPRTSPAKCRFRTQTSGHLPTVTGG